MAKTIPFLTPSQEQTVVAAIKRAEKNTSGEVRVHIEKHTNKPPMERAKEVFYFLKMDQTKLKNGVLLYIATDSKKFAILGDEGIDTMVPKNFWDAEKELVVAHFSKGEFTQGLAKAIDKVGEKLKIFFPYQANDTNELFDKISKG